MVLHVRAQSVAVAFLWLAATLAAAQTEPASGLPPASAASPPASPRWSEAADPAQPLPLRPAAAPRARAIGFSAVSVALWLPVVLVDARGALICETRLAMRLRIAEVPGRTPRAVADALAQARPLVLAVDDDDARACGRLRLIPASEVSPPDSQLR